MSLKKIQLNKLVTRLQKEGYLTPEQVEQVYAGQGNAHDKHPVSYVASFNFKNVKQAGQFLDSEAIMQLLGAKIGQPYYHIDPLKVDVAKVTKVLSFEFSKRHQILVVESNQNDVVVASAEPYVTDWMEGVQHVSRKEVRRVVTSPEDLARYMVEFFTVSASVSKATDQQFRTGGNIVNLEQMLEIGKLSGNPDANDEHIVNIVDWLLQYAFDQRASDIHIEPRRDEAHVRFRIDGVLHSVYEFPFQVAAAVVSRIKTLGRMDLAEKRRPQDGRLKTKTPDGSEVELRLSTLPTAFGEKLVMRIFDPEVLLRTFAQLGLKDSDYDRWDGMITQPNGIVIVTGPTGSGKTTTLYSTLKQLATSEVNVCTIEDPIEMVEGSFNQMQVQHNIDLTFASGIRALLRQDPDIIMIGEIRDLETAEMAIQAALTGHLVLTTLHTNDAATAITRLLELGVPSYLIKATLLGVMAQRLVRTLCPSCKQPTDVDTEGWKTITQPWNAAPPKQMHEPVGCLECRNTGYRGRVGVYEIMTMSDALKDIIQDHTDLAKLRRQAYKEGTFSLRLSGAQKIAAGLTTVEEVLRVTPKLD